MNSPNPKLLLILFVVWILLCVSYVTLQQYGVTISTTSSQATRNLEEPPKLSPTLVCEPPIIPPTICNCSFTVQMPPPTICPSCPTSCSSCPPVPKCPACPKPRIEPPAILPEFSLPIPNDCSSRYGPIESRRVYTYHQVIPGFRNDSELLQLWDLSWRANCWEPMILNETHAMLHKEFTPLMQKLEQLPTINPKQYELSCYTRYLAMSVVGGGIMVDNDVINMNFMPNEMTSPLPERFACYDGAVPSMVYGTGAEYDRVIKHMANYQITPQDTYNDRNHTSDMLILNKMLGAKLVDYMSESPVRSKKLRHLSARLIASIRSVIGVGMGKQHVARMAMLLMR